MRAPRRFQRREGARIHPRHATLIAGRRGFASYGPIWSGKLSGEPDQKTDDIEVKRRLYPLFAAPVAAK